MCWPENVDLLLPNVAVPPILPTFNYDRNEPYPRRQGLNQPALPKSLKIFSILVRTNYLRQHQELMLKNFFGEDLDLPNIKKLNKVGFDD